MACRYTTESALATNLDAVLTIGILSTPQAPHEEFADGHESGVRPFLDTG